MAWQRHIAAGELRTSLSEVQQFAGGPAMLAPICRKSRQSKSLNNVSEQDAGLCAGGAGSGLAAEVWSTAMATTTMAMKETVDGAIAALPDCCCCCW